MSYLDIVLEMLWRDTQFLGTILCVVGLIWLVPSFVITFVAAARTEPTLWRDLPAGVFWGWLAGSAALAVCLALSLAALAIGNTGESWLSISFVFGCSGFAAVVANYRAAVRFHRQRIQDRLGWKLDYDPPEPAKRRFSFTLRQLLISQMVFIFAFALWVGARRDQIVRKYRFRQEEAERMEYMQSVERRFGSYGWTTMFEMEEGLWLGQSRGRLSGFRDEVLERIEPRDRLFELTLRSNELTDAGLEILSRNDNVQQLEIASDRVTDKGIAHLKRLKKLKRLTLECPALTAASLEELRALESLQYLTLYASQIPRERADELGRSHFQAEVHIFPFPSQR